MTAVVAALTAVIAVSLVVGAGTAFADTPGTDLIVSPNQNLNPAGQSVAVSGTGFGPNGTGVIQQCIQVDEFTEECSNNIGTFPTSANGLFGPVSVTVMANFTPDATPRSCSASQPCSVFAEMDAQPQNAHEPITFAAPPPVAQTDPATSVGTTGATLNASVNPNGVATTYKYEYGTTTSFGTVIGPFNAGSGTTLTAQPGQAITGLAPNTTYFYRVVARHGTNPEVFGQVRAFTTGGSPTAPAAVTGAASSITATGASIAGTVNAHGRATAYIVEYGTTTSFGSITAPQSAGSSTADLAVTVPMGGLSPGTTYYYRLVATNAIGTTAGALMTFTTAPTAPTVVTGAASAITPTSATLSGTLNPRNGATTFTFEYGTTVSFGNITAVDKVPGVPAVIRTVTLPVTELTPNITYLYRLVATNANGTTRGSAVSFKTLPAA